MYEIKMPTWEAVEDKITAYTTKMSLDWNYLSRVASGEYPADAFDKGQLISKAWLLREYKMYIMSRMRSEPRTVALLGCWIGTLVEPLLKDDCMIERVWGFDSDQSAVDLSNKFNQKHVNNHWKYKAVCEDINLIDWSQPQYEVDGRLIEQRPSLVINTSAEHMEPTWFSTLSSDQLVILQTNNNHDIPGHDYAVSSEEELRKMFPMQEILYIGAMVLPNYTRYMMVGYPQGSER